MSSVAEKEINNFMSGTLSNTRILVLFGVLGSAMLIGASIKDPNLKIKWPIKPSIISKKDSKSKNFI